MRRLHRVIVVSGVIPDSMPLSHSEILGRIFVNGQVEQAFRGDFGIDFFGLLELGHVLGFTLNAGRIRGKVGRW